LDKKESKGQALGVLGRPIKIQYNALLNETSVFVRWQAMIRDESDESNDKG
jgi:hypothetical protein